MTTLQDLCLTVIVEEFDSYYVAFNTTEDANLKQKFEFLQRTYSFKIVTQLNLKNKLEEKYIDLLINKYLQVLDTQWLIKCTWKTVVAKVAEIGPTIKTIYLHECTEERPWQEIFCHLPNLEIMSFHDNCTNEVLRNVAKFCPNVTEIDARSSLNIDENGLKYLCEQRNGKLSCPKLKKLFLEFCRITRKIAGMLIRSLPSLEVFDYEYLPLVLYIMHKQNLPEIDKIQPYNLNKLDFFPLSGLTHFADILKLCSSVCPYVTSLSCPMFGPQCLDLFSRFLHLEVLHLECQQKDEVGVNKFLKLNGSKLTSLTVGNCCLSVLTLARSCTSLKLLSMNNVSFEDHDDSIPLFHNLESLTIRYTEFTYNSSNCKSACLILSLSPKLESITFERFNLSSNEVKAEILKCFERRFVKNINFFYCTVDKQFVMDILLTCHSLKIFNLGESELDSDDDEICRCVEMLPNNPVVVFTKLLSRVSNYDYNDDLDDNFLPEF